MRMKHLLMGTSALAVGAMILTSAPSPALAQLEISLGGFVRSRAFFAEEDQIRSPRAFGPAAADATDRGYAFDMEARPQIRVLGVTDSGINYGTRLEFQLTRQDANNFRRGHVFFSGAFGRLEFGTEDGVVDNMTVGGKTTAGKAGTGGIDGALPGLGATIGAVQNLNTDKAAKVTYYTPRVAGFQAGVSYTPDSGDGTPAARFSGDQNLGQFENHLEVGANYIGSFAGVDLGASAIGSFGDAEVAGEQDMRAWSVGGTAGFAGAEVGGTYGRNRPGMADALGDAASRDYFWNVAAAYGIGPATVGASFQHRKPSGGDRRHAIIGSATYALFPGMRLQGDLGYVDVRNGNDFLTGVFAARLDF